MSKVWPHDQIRELLTLAELNGSARAELGSAEEAEKFRFALYYFRRQHQIGQGLSITIEDSFVIVEKREMREVTIVRENIDVSN